MAKAKSSTRHESITQLGDMIARAVAFTSTAILDEAARSDAALKARLLNDLQRHCEDRIFWTLAQSAQDAMIQIARISGELDAFDDEKDAGGPKWERLKGDIDRALYSIMRWIENAHSVERPAVVDFYMTANLDPWNTLIEHNTTSHVPG